MLLPGLPIFLQLTNKLCRVLDGVSQKLAPTIPDQEVLNIKMIS